LVEISLRTALFANARKLFEKTKADDERLNSARSCCRAGTGMNHLVVHCATLSSYKKHRNISIERQQR
jgi:hypothetical protein